MDYRKLKILLKTINLHTHSPIPAQQSGLLNQSVLVPFQFDENQYYSVGLHPWNLQEASGSNWLEQLNQLALHPQVLAIGECGLDRSIETPLDEQTRFFAPQIELADKLQKPVMLHAVRTYSELMLLKRQLRSDVPWILHAYNGNGATSRQLLKQDIYFSIGTALLKNSPKLLESLQVIPLSRLFFETDTAAEDIESIYTFAAELLDMDLEELQEQVFENFQRIFLK